MKESATNDSELPFVSWNAFDTTKSLANTLRVSGVLNSFLEYAKTSFNLLDVRIDNRSILIAMHKWSVLMKENFAGAMPTDDFQILLVEGMKFMAGALVPLFPHNAVHGGCLFGVMRERVAVHGRRLCVRSWIPHALLNTVGVPLGGPCVFNMSHFMEGVCWRPLCPTRVTFHGVCAFGWPSVSHKLLFMGGLFGESLWPPTHCCSYWCLCVYALLKNAKTCRQPVG